VHDNGCYRALRLDGVEHAEDGLNHGLRSVDGQVVAARRDIGVPRRRSACNSAPPSGMNTPHRFGVDAGDATRGKHVGWDGREVWTGTAQIGERRPNAGTFGACRPKRNRPLGWVAQCLLGADSVLTLIVTIPSLTFLSYQATRIRPGAATALAAVAAFAVVVQLLLAAKAGQGMPLGTLAALVVGPSMALTGGLLALKSHQR
jgi:hypothetical protein